MKGIYRMLPAVTTGATPLLKGTELPMGMGCPDTKKVPLTSVAQGSEWMDQRGLQLVDGFLDLLLSVAHDLSPSQRSIVTQCVPGRVPGSENAGFTRAMRTSFRTGSDQIPAVGPVQRACTR